MKTVLIHHGIMGKAGENWSQWLSDELVKRNLDVIMPSLSNPDRPDRQTWLNEIRELVKDVKNQNLIIVAHSLGVPSALDYIETLDSPIAGFISVSGFAYAYGFELNDYFMKEKDINFESIRRLAGRTSVYFGDDDPYVTQEALLHLAEELKVDPNIIHEGGHLNSAAGFDTFPEILEDILKTKD